MTKQVIYKYLGTNGVIESPVHLEDIYYVRLFDLIADSGKILVNGHEKHHAVRVPEEEVKNWTEETF
ncbi:MAG: hypothetical protein IIT65_09315 [Lachnospiraceae bacterium]|nr:hypothetical protein [Lachnospiraceae bacterium]